jgi:ABC-2 type transport system permease protein
MALTQMLVMPLFFLSGALYPLRALTAWLTVLTRFDAITYVVYPTRSAVFRHLNVSPAASAALSRPSRGTAGQFRWASHSASSR